MANLIAIGTLALIIVVQAIERYFFARSMLEQLERAMKAAMSRDVNDYVNAVKNDKKAPEPPEREPESIELNLADDETFDKHIKQTIG